MRPINLLPPEVAAARSRRRKVLGLIALFVLYVILLGVGVVYWNGKVSDAEADVTVQEDENAALRREAAALAEAEVLKLEFEAQAALVRQALVQEVDWGILLNDLARLLPPRIWVQEFTGTITDAEPGVAGLVTFSGVGFDYPDVASWLRALDSEDFVGVTGSWVSSAAESKIGEADVVIFSSSAALTEAATTDRAEDLIPEVP
jgi:Tfp pilus assembly protein PilN